MSDPVVAACLECVRAAEAPLALRQIRQRLEKPLRFPPRRVPEFQGLLAERARAGEIHEWPGTGKAGPRFWRLSVQQCLREELLAALAQTPDLLSPLLKAVRPRLHKTSAVLLNAHAETVLAVLDSEGLVRKAPLGRQALYVSRDWAAKFAGPATGQGGLAGSILTAVAAMESGCGNYVPVYRLRNGDAVRAEFDRAVIALAEAGKLVLSSYNGPRPVPPDRVSDYVEDEQGRLYVAVAQPLPPGVS